MLDNIIKKLSIIITLCIILVAILYFTPLYDIVNVEIEKKVEEFKEDTKEEIEEKKTEIKQEVKKVEDKVKSKLDSNIDELKKLKLKNVLKELQ